MAPARTAARTSHFPRPPRSAPLALLPLIPIVLFSGCGLENPYKTRSKKCKTNCEVKSSDLTSGEPRKTPSFPLDLSLWSARTVRSPFQDAADAVPTLNDHLGSNPFVLSGKVLADTGGDIGLSLQAQAKKSPRTSNETCYVNAFGEALSPKEEGYALTADYGKCANLAELSKAQTEAFAKAGKDIQATYLELEIASRLEVGSSARSESGASVFARVAKASDVLDVFPYQAFRAAPQADAKYENARLSFLKGVLNTYRLAASNGQSATKRTWSMVSAGEPDGTPLILVQILGEDTLSLNGSLSMLSGSLYDPDLASPFSFEGKEASGWTRKYVFDDFRMSAPGISPNIVFGFSPEAALSGHFELHINGPLGDASGAPGKVSAAGASADKGLVFRFEGRGQPCILDVSAIEFPQGQAPRAEPFGQADICQRKFPRQ